MAYGLRFVGSSYWIPWRGEVPARDPADAMAFGTKTEAGEFFRDHGYLNPTEALYGRAALEIVPLPDSSAERYAQFSYEGETR